LRSATVLVISSHRVIEGIVRMAGEANPDVSRVAVLGPASALETTVQIEAPAVIVVDVDPAALGDLEIVHRVRAASSDARIIVLSERADGQQVLDAMRLGVHAFLRKPDGLRDIVSTLERVLAGERVIASDLERSAVLELGRFARQARQGSEVGATLTPRERQILELLAEGFTMQQIGRRLGISPRTVETHVAKLYRKLEVRTRVQAVSRAAALGLIELR
jgi:DNA-binding NarL/FixJ family response regulator